MKYADPLMKYPQLLISGVILESLKKITLSLIKILLVLIKKCFTMFLTISFRTHKTGALNIFWLETLIFVSCVKFLGSQIKSGELIYFAKLFELFTDYLLANSEKILIWRKLKG